MESFVRARAFIRFVKCVRVLGGDPDPILRLAGIDPGLLADPLNWIPFRANLRAFQLASHTLKAPNFGIQVAMCRDLNYMGPLLLAARHSPDLKSALEAFSRYLGIQNTGYQTSIQMGPKTGIRLYQMSSDLRVGADQWIEESLLSSKLFISNFLGEDVPAIKVYMRHKPLRPPAAYRADYGAPVFFQQAIDGIEFDRTIFARPLATYDENIKAFITSYLDERVRSLDSDVVLVTRSLLESLIPLAQGRLEVVAEHLKLHPRTLQRRLRERGYSFSALLEDQRRLMADRLLREGNLPLTKVANHLGYGEQSSFNHAFERWHGKSPLEWLRRRRQKEALSPKSKVLSE